MNRILATISQNWPKYLLEVATLIIGIYGAFALDNWNEHRKEQDTAKVLAASLDQDLHKDIAFLDSAIAFSADKIAACDSLIFLISQERKQWQTHQIYRQITLVGSSNPFFPTNGTYQQMITSGTLKIFSQEVANQLNAYDMQLQKVKYWENVEDEALWLLADIIWDGMDVRSIGAIRFGNEVQGGADISIPKTSLIRLKNLISATQIYRKNTLTEYNVQLQLANNLTKSLGSIYQKQ